MGWLDPVARGATTALLVVTAFVLRRARPRDWTSSVTSGLFASVTAYLVVSAPVYRPWPLLDFVLRAAALATPASFSLFTRAFFGDERRGRWRDGATVVATVAVGLGRPGAFFEACYYLASVALVVHALYHVGRGLPIDLVESRRRVRMTFTVIVGLEILVVLATEWVLGGRPAPPGLELLKSVGALCLAAGFCGWLLAPRADILPLDVEARATVATASPAAADEDARHRDRLLALVSADGLYREEGLTIGGLARRLELPEYRVRRIINRQLGYRNFNAFVNELRVAEACRRLADPAHERLPIFNLALDLGYGSVGPFNRAFRERTGVTPTEYRRARFADAGTESSESPVGT